MSKNLTTCELCGGQAANARVRRVWGRNGSEVDVVVVDCPVCDRSRCKECREYVQDTHKQRCPAGHVLWQVQ